MVWLRNTAKNWPSNVQIIVDETLPIVKLPKSSCSWETGTLRMHFFFGGGAW
jgi:hypothetical protein